MILEGKIALITGGSRGIGLAVARSFLKEGVKVMLSARSRDELEKARSDLKKDFPAPAVFPADVSNYALVKSLVEEAKKTFGKIDILVNAAGIYGPIGPTSEIDVDLWRKTYEINVFGTFHMIREVLPLMIKNRSGKIINFSGGGDGPLPNFSAYNSSKVAIVRLTETIAAEVRDFGIDINCIAPGPVNTSFLEEALKAGEKKVGKSKYQELLKQKADGGVAPEKSAELSTFLASSVSNGLTGKFLSAVWDDWRKWDKEMIKEISKTELYTLRRKI
ncbi:MAG: SDR family oxidoreductase [Candidatus Liptonbacteria bacterium]|nr:SDR family oxidoreductase [Candidatus Liptonbacteria bacterium]